MLYVSAPVAAEAMDEWVLDDYAAKHRVAIDRLLQLRVFVETHERREVSYKMNQKFQVTCKTIWLMMEVYQESRCHQMLVADC